MDIDLFINYENYNVRSSIIFGFLSYCYILVVQTFLNEFVNFFGKRLSCQRLGNFVEIFDSRGV